MARTTPRPVWSAKKKRIIKGYGSAARCFRQNFICYICITCTKDLYSYYINPCVHTKKKLLSTLLRNAFLSRCSTQKLVFETHQWCCHQCTCFNVNKLRSSGFYEIILRYEFLIALPVLVNHSACNYLYCIQVF